MAEAPFTWRVRIYWEDTDAGGIVFYANYLKYFERARTEWLRALGIGQQALREQTGGMFVVSETHTRHLQPARLDDELWIRTELVKPGRVVLELLQQARLGPAGPLLCEATIRIAWVQEGNLKPGRIPTDILQRLTHASLP